MFINGLVVVRGPVVENHKTKSTFLLSSTPPSSSTPPLPKQQPVSEPDVYELLLKFYLFFKLRPCRTHSFIQHHPQQQTCTVVWRWMKTCTVVCCLQVEVTAQSGLHGGSFPNNPFPVLCPRAGLLRLQVHFTSLCNKTVPEAELVLVIMLFCLPA